MRSFLRSVLKHKATKPCLLMVGLVPFAWLIWGAANNALGANPAEYLIRSTGDWTLRMLCVVLAITPLRQLFGLPELAAYRRMWGLFVYFYVSLHLLSYAGFDMAFEWGDIVADIVKRPFILVGFAAFVLLTPLALTSWNGAIRRLGAKRWQWLHRCSYVIAGLAVLHFAWMRSGKHNYADVWLYGSVLGLLLAYRVVKRWQKKAT